MISIEFRGSKEAIDAIKRLQQSIASPSFLFDEYYREYYQPLARKRFDRIRRETPYASTGWKKKRSGVIAGGAGDRGFAVDSGAFQDDVLNKFEATDEGLRLFSDQPYADRLNGLLQAKSPYPAGAIFLDEQDLNEFEDRLGNAIDRVFEA